MHFPHPNAERPIDFIPYARHRFPEWQLEKLSPHEQQALIQRGLASRSWDELQMLIETLGDQ